MAKSCKGVYARLLLFNFLMFIKNQGGVLTSLTRLDDQLKMTGSNLLPSPQVLFCLVMLLLHVC
jgi:hypothetical protein